MSAEQRSQNIPSQLPPSPASHNKHTLITCILSCRRTLALSPLQGHPPQTCFRKQTCLSHLIPNNSHPTTTPSPSSAASLGLCVHTGKCLLMRGPPPVGKYVEYLERACVHACMHVNMYVHSFHY